MTNKTIHIVLFDVPYPANYGGIIDVFYKLKSLHQLGVQIICHCYYYDKHNPPTAELNTYCKTVYYYERKKQLNKLLFSKLPYIVSSRSDNQLLKNLKKDNFPILFEGLHTCYFLTHSDLKERKKIVRTHNIEHDYYSGLAKIETNLLKRLYLQSEAKKLKKFEQNLSHSNCLLSISKMDITHFNQYAKTIHVPPFFNENKKNSTSQNDTISQFCLFQGNLSVPENIKAVNFILDKIAPDCPFLIKIAGKNPTELLKNKVNTLTNVQLIENPSEEEMAVELQTAQVNLLFTFQQTGVKLKLINALQQGKHVIINSFMEDSGIFKDMCYVIDEPNKILSRISTLMEIPFTRELSKSRENKFQTYFHNSKNAQLISDLL